MKTVSVVIRATARKDGKRPVCLRVGVDGKYSFETLCYVKATHFNAAAKLVYSYEPDSPRMNQEIRRRFKELTELIDHYDSKRWACTPQDLLSINYEDWKKQLNKDKQQVKESVPNGFITYVQEVIIPYWKDKKNLSNAEKYKLESDIFSNFLATLKPKRVDVRMELIDNALIENYFSYLRSKKIPCKKDSTLKRRLGQIEAVLNHAHRVSGVISTVPSLNVDLNVLKPKKPKLTKEQIDQMEGYHWDFENIPAGATKKGYTTMRQAVQTFLLQYYLFGARVGDVLLLRNQSVIVQKGVPVRIEYYQQKGRKKEGKRLMSININASLSAIIQEYWNPDKPNEYLMPWMIGRDGAETQMDLSPEQNAFNLKEAVHAATSLVNAQLRAACTKYIGLDAPAFASHSARHSFAQRAKTKGKSIEWIKETLGHSTYDITAHYLADLESDELNTFMQDVYD